MFDQMRAIDKTRLGKKIGSLSFKEMNEVELVLKFVLGFN